MRRTVTLLAALLFASALLVSCGGGSSSFTPSPGSTAFSLTMTDAPPAGVTVLSFEVTVTGAVLQPGNVSLVSSPLRVEVTQLETERAFLITRGVAAGTYQGITVTFANPEMTIKNDSGAAIGGCAAGAVCELQPSLTTSSVTFTGAPFPLTLGASTSTGLLLDFNLNQSVQSDLSVTPTISFTQLPVVKETDEDELDELDDLEGMITAVDSANNQFTLQVTESGQSLTLKVDSNTQFEGFNPNAFSSLKTGQIVEASAKLQGSGILLATKVELKQQENEEELEGTIVSVDSLTQFKMVVLDEVPDMAGVSVGNPVTVTLQSNASFSVDSEDLSLSSDLTFNSSADLMVGQNVEVRPVTGSSGASIVTDQVRLRSTQLTATISSTNGSNFTVGNLPSLFTSSGTLSIEVRTSSQTEFENVSSAAGLSAGDTVSLRGLLFKSLTGPPVMTAVKVVKR